MVSSLHINTNVNGKENGNMSVNGVISSSPVSSPLSSPQNYTSPKGFLNSIESVLSVPAVISFIASIPLTYAIVEISAKYQLFHPLLLLCISGLMLVVSFRIHMLRYLTLCTSAGMLFSIPIRPLVLSAQTYPTFSHALSAFFIAKSGFWSTETFINISIALVLQFASIFGIAFIEHIWYVACEILARKGQLFRLAPSIPLTKHQYELGNISAICGSYLPFFYFVATHRQGFIDRMELNFNPIHLIVFTLCVAMMHDFWFYLFHSNAHLFRVLYYYAHRLHHESVGDISAFSTIFGEALDIFGIWGIFYSGLYVHLFFQPTWNPVTLIYYMLVSMSANNVGHCGYHINKFWSTILSGGMFALPWYTGSTIHYIHHLCEKWNRALYYSWWDRLFGTYQPKHRLVLTPGTKEYEAALKKVQEKNSSEPLPALSPTALVNRIFTHGHHVKAA